MPAKLEIFKDKKGEFRFRLKAANGEIILASEGYKARKSTLNGIASVQRNAPNDNRYVRKQTKTGSRFNLTATNGQVIGTSETYKTDKARENGIASVAKNAPKASIND